MKLQVLLLLLVSTGLLKAQNNLEIKIVNIKNDIGNIIVGLYSEDNHFPKNASDGKIVKASRDGVSVVFLNIKPGIYAVSALHDENQNQDLDQNGLGIPKEGFGFSNNARGTMGPPSFHKAQIDLSLGRRDTTIAIDMKYMGKRKD